MEIEHELHAGSLDAGTQHLDGIEVLDHALAHVGSRCVLRVDEQANTGGIPALLLEPGNDVVDNLAVHVVVMGRAYVIALQSHQLVGLILGEHRDVTAHDIPIVGLNTTTQNDVNDSIHVGNAHLAVIVHVALTVHVTGQYHVDDSVHIGDGDLAVTVHIAHNNGIGAERCQRHCH